MIATIKYLPKPKRFFKYLGVFTMLIVYVCVCVRVLKEKDMKTVDILISL